jgi:hypothetical protein
MRLKQEVGDVVELAFSPAIGEQNRERALRDALELPHRAVMQDSPAVKVLLACSIEHVMRDLFGPFERALSQSSAVPR